MTGSVDVTLAITGAATIAEAMTEAVRRLAAAGVAEPRREARILVGHGLGVRAEYVIGHPERELKPDEWARIEAAVARRCTRRPLAQVLGKREFWSLEFAVTPDTLDPRADSECLIEAVLAHVPDRNARLDILDLGTGTGCLLLTLLHEMPNARGTGVDISAAALKVARRNAESLGLAARARFLEGDWGGGIEGRFDVIVANPPYVPAAELARLQPEVALFEPRLALDGGTDGLAQYRRLAPDLARLLATGGIAVIELGLGQQEAAAAILGEAGLESTAVALDLALRERAIVAKRAQVKGPPVGKKGLE